MIDLRNLLSAIKPYFLGWTQSYLTRYDDLLPLPVTVGPGLASPAAMSSYNGGSLVAYEFVNTATKAYYAGWQLSHKWREGTVVYPHLHLFIPSGTTGDVKFTMNYTWVNVDAVEGSETVIYGTCTKSSGTSNNGNALLKLDSAAISGTGKTISSILLARIARDPADAADTFGASVWMKSIDMHIQYDSNGSLTEWAK
jgi:hypothetical protein